jgi:uncharacterized RDD family membrane protein YckC
MGAPGSLADRGARLLAASIDELILLGISLPMLFGALPTLMSLVSAAIAGAPGPGEINPELIDTGDIVRTMLSGRGTIVTVVALLAWCVITAWLVAANGQSIGKRLVGIKVVRTDGSPASFARILFLRNVVNGLPNLLPYVGWLYQLVDPLLIYQESRRCLHDRIADTIVVACESKAKGSI